MKLGYIGCYAQTELGHGSNVRGLQTTATFVPGPAGHDGDGEWVLDTPTLQSAKWWSTGMFSATHACVYAQMILRGKVRGVHVFFVQLRGEDLLPLPGVEIGECGPKLGDNDTPIGYLRLRGVRIPRRHLLEKRQRVSREGEYIVGAATASKSKSKSKSKSESESESESKGRGKSKAHYVTML